MSKPKMISYAMIKSLQSLTFLKAFHVVIYDICSQTSVCFDSFNDSIDDSANSYFVSNFKMFSVL